MAPTRRFAHNPPMTTPANPNVPLTVVHADDHLAIISKPAGVVTQPGIEHTDDTVLNGLMARWRDQLQALGLERDWGLIHRLDRPTSGLLVVGLSPEGYDGVRAQFVARTVKKRYVALVHGAPQPNEGIIRQSLSVIRSAGRKKSVSSNGRGSKEAITRYTQLSKNRHAALVECQIETGRLHQIRAHMALRGCAVVGDREYGPRNEYDTHFAKEVGRKAIGLHAGELSFVHPVTRGRLTVRAPLPPEWRAFLDAEGIECPRGWRR